MYIACSGSARPDTKLEIIEELCNNSGGSVDKVTRIVSKQYKFVQRVRIKKIAVFS